MPYDSQRGCWVCVLGNRWGRASWFEVWNWGLRFSDETGRSVALEWRDVRAVVASRHDHVRIHKWFGRVEYSARWITSGSRAESERLHILTTGGESHQVAATDRGQVFQFNIGGVGGTVSRLSQGALEFCAALEWSGHADLLDDRLASRYLRRNPLWPPPLTPNTVAAGSRPASVVSGTRMELPPLSAAARFAGLALMMLAIGVPVVAGVALALRGGNAGVVTAACASAVGAAFGVKRLVRRWRFVPSAEDVTAVANWFLSKYELGWQRGRSTVVSGRWLFACHPTDHDAVIRLEAAAGGRLRPSVVPLVLRLPAVESGQAAVWLSPWGVHLPTRTGRWRAWVAWDKITSAKATGYGHAEDARLEQVIGRLATAAAGDSGRMAPLLWQIRHPDGALALVEEPPPASEVGRLQSVADLDAALGTGTRGAPEIPRPAPSIPQPRPGPARSSRLRTAAAAAAAVIAIVGVVAGFVWALGPDFGGNEFVSAADTHDSPQRRLDRALLRVAARGDLVEVDDLLGDGANPNFSEREQRTGHKTTALGRAVSAGHRDVTARLLEAGASSDIADAVAGSAVMVAVLNDDDALVALLIEAGASIMVPDANGRTPLEVASNRGQAGMVGVLLGAGADLNPEWGDVPTLIYAIRGGSVETVQALINAGVDPNLPWTTGGHTPLMEAAADGNLGIVEALLAAGADPNARTTNEDQYSALGIARVGSEQAGSVGTADGYAAVIARLEPITTS